MGIGEPKKTVIIGATTNSSRYAFVAAGMLREYNHEIIPVGIKKGEVYGRTILNINQRPRLSDVDTITLYISPRHQPEHYDYILSLKPRRVIFNPGTENPEFQKMLEESGTEALEACTLVLLRSGQY
jgi:uncharacterized protein